MKKLDYNTFKINIKLKLHKKMLCPRLLVIRYLQSMKNEVKYNC